MKAAHEGQDRATRRKKISVVVVLVGGSHIGLTSRNLVTAEGLVEVVGDIHHQSLAIERGAHFEGRSLRVRGANEEQHEKVGRRSLREIARKDSEVVPSARGGA
jgi:cytoskeletal protein CcmA (bactofilin family)